MKIFAGIIILLILLLATFFTVTDSNRIEKLHKQYPKLTIQDCVFGKVSKLYTEKGASFITIGDKNFFIGTTSNDLYPNFYFDDILTTGDSVVKHANSDTIFIYKKKSVYYFNIHR